MFRKKPTLKSLAPLRSSDRRKLIDQIIKQYDLEVPKDESDELEKGGDCAHELSDFRNAILPDGTLAANFITTAGPELKPVKGVIYVGTHPGDQQRILFIKLDDGRLVPSVYTLWRRPHLLPLLHTPAVVVQKMREGADLNTPGLAGPPFPPKARKGATVAVASVEEPSVPMAVGICEVDVSILTEVRGQKGHAVRPVHCEGDEIWNWSQLGQGGQAAPEHIEAWLEAETQTPLQGLTLKEDQAASFNAGGVRVDGERPSISEAIASTGPSKEWTTKEIDTAFRNALLFALYKARENNGSDPNYGVDFPITQSQLVSNFVTPFLPIHSPEDAAALQMKKTSWKNVKKFIKTLDKEMLLKSKDRNGGETVVLDIDFEDQALVTFTPYRLPKKDATTLNISSGSNGAILNAAQPPDTSIGQRLQRLVLLRPKDKLSSVFGGINTRSLYPPQDLKPLITRYIEDEALANSANRRIVNLDPVLSNSVFDSGSSIDNEVLAKGSVTREVLIERIIASCSPFWVILRNDDARDDSKAKAGKPPTIKINLETRSGNKTATRVAGLEPYHINVQYLADELQKACASSTSTSAIPGSTPKNPLHEIMVQGPQKDAVLKALERRGVRRDWVEISDKTKGKKK